MAETRNASAMIDIRRRRLGLLTAACVLLVAHARMAGAQTQQTGGAYVSGSVLADLKSFSGDPSSDVLSGHGIGGAVAVGSSLGSRWDVEVGVDAPRFTEKTESSTVTIRRELITLESRTKNRTLSVSALLRYRASPGKRLTIGYLAGLSFLRLQRRFDTQGPDGTPDALIPRPQELVDYGPAPTLGVDMGVPVTLRLSVVVAVHATAFAFREVSGVLVRPRIGVRWQF
jgi:hypothetical protein